MDGQNLPVRYWGFEGAMPLDDVVEGRISTGIAYHVERKERLAYVRIASVATGKPEWEMWLDRDTARELAVSLATLEPWFGAGNEPEEGELGQPTEPG